MITGFYNEIKKYRYYVKNGFLCGKSRLVGNERIYNRRCESRLSG